MAALPGGDNRARRRRGTACVTVPEGDARDYLEKSGTAFICKPDDVDHMVRHLDHVYSAWQKGQSVVSPNWEFIKGFERSRLTDKLARFFEQVLQAH